MFRQVHHHHQNMNSPDTVLMQESCSSEPQSGVSIIHHATYINNRGALHLQNGSYQEAVSDLAQTLKLIAQQVRLGVQQSASLSNTNDTRTPSLIAPFSVESINPFVKAPYPEQLSNHSQHIQRLVFRRPMFIRQGADPLPVTVETLETISYVAVFNLALAWQLRGLSATNQASQDTMLSKALSLYEHAIKIFRNGHVRGEPVHYMAVLCNMGTIHSCANDVEKSIACQNQLLSAVMCCIESRYSGGPQWDGILEGFLLNVMPTLMTPTAASAA